MAKGMRLPVSVSTRGGATTLEGSDLLRQNILLGIKPASSLNPWNQRLTPREDTIFDLADEMTGGMLISHIQSFFEELEALGMAALHKGRRGLILDVSDRERGNVELIVNYIDLEENKSREIRLGSGV
jgi:hypothetical protein